LTDNLLFTIYSYANALNENKVKENEIEEPLCKT